MTLHLTRDEWDRIAAEGGGVLFREGIEIGCDECGADEDEPDTFPPAEFVEAAQPCETCGPFGGGTVEVHTGEYIKGAPVYRFADCPNPDCLDGKRRIAVAVPCEWPQHYILTPRSTPPFGVPRGDIFTDVRCPHPCQAGPKLNDRTSRFVTVGNVVVTFGPLVVYLDTDELAFRPDHLCVIVGTQGNDAGWVAVWHGNGEFTPISLPPDVDPQSLVGQYALGMEVTS